MPLQRDGVIIYALAVYAAAPVYLIGAIRMNTVENINKVKRIRGYGEGSVYQRKDGRWVGKYKDEKMLKPRYVYGKTEAEARRKLREFKKTIVHGITDCRKVLLSTYIERWLYTFKAAAVENTSFDRLESVYYTRISSRRLAASNLGISKRLIFKHC